MIIFLIDIPESHMLFKKNLYLDIEFVLAGISCTLSLRSLCNV